MSLSNRSRPRTYLANHRHTCLHFPRVEVRVKDLDRHQLRHLVLSAEDVDQTVQLHHAKVLTSLRRSTGQQTFSTGTSSASLALLLVEL